MSLPDRILHLFDAYGNHGYDEAVSMAEHMLQTAALAEAAECSTELVAAALLHDIGHLLLAEQDAANPLSEHRTTDLRHEDVAERFLRDHFGPAVVVPVALHVRAKRYLCATDASYFQRLSPSSVHTLALQGGPMDGDEVAAFEQLEHWRDAVTIRRLDDDAKVVGVATPTVVELLPRLLPNSGNRT